MPGAQLSLVDAESWGQAQALLIIERPSVFIIAPL